MSVFVALLRAVNVGGTGKLAMSGLRSLCQDAGLQDVQTYIQSGNVVFRTRLGEAKVRAELERVLAAKPVGVLVRTGEQIAHVLERNPYPKAAPNQVIVFFLNEAPKADALEGWPIPGQEKLELSGRELFIHYPEGQGRSKLKVPFSDLGTGRNLRTLAKLADMARALE